MGSSGINAEHMGCFTGVETNKSMNLLVAVSLAILGAAVAEPGYYHGYGHHGYGGYGHHGYHGKREAEAEAKAVAEPGYYHHGYSHHGYGHHGYHGKREAEAEPGYY